METILKDFEKSAGAVLSALSGEIAGVRTSRPSPALVEDLKIEYFDQQVPIKQLGSISVIPPREMAITLWDPSGVTTVAKALEDAKRGFTVSVRGGAVYISLPPLSEERREEMIKLAKSIAESYRIRLRGSRESANKQLQAAKAAKSITEDMEARGKKKVQEITDRINKEIDILIEKKIKEISE
jgi:ribosome recycling factor